MSELPQKGDTVTVCTLNRELNSDQFVLSSGAPHLRVEYGRVVTVAAINDPGPPVAGRQPPGEHGDKCTGEYHLGAHHEQLSIIRLLLTSMTSCLLAN